MIYVDRLRETKPSREWPFTSGCHLFADSLEELHAFAASIGMKRIWFQSQARLPHYDLNARRRAQALELGAKEIDGREISKRIRAARGIQEKRSISQDEWRGCYSGSWKGLITDEAFCHPAKFSRNLIKKIYDHLFDQGLLRAGSAVVDPFGGIALGGLEAMLHGCHWQGCELEGRFVALGQDNVQLWEQRFLGLKTIGSARIIQGDSRRLLEVIRQADAVVSSPPYADQLDPKRGGGKHKDGFHQVATDGKFLFNAGYSMSDANMGNMPEGDFNAIISSPPYVKPPGHDTGHARLDAAEDKRRAAEGCARRNGYGESDGQLSSMPEGDFNACVSSPPFNANKSNTLHGQTKGFHSHDENEAKSRMKRDYLLAETDGNLGNMDMGDGCFNGCISSPPFSPTENQPLTGGQGVRADLEAAGKVANARYGTGHENLGNLPITDEGFNAAVSSPPYEDQLDPHRGGGKHKAGFTQGSTAGAFLFNQGYSVNKSNLGNNKQSFWAAAREIVAQTYESLAPGGVACWVTKAYIKNGAVVDFPGRWRHLCESIGFVTIHEHHALQVEDKAEQCGLFGESKRIKSSHKSFFKIVYEKKRPDLAIDFEVIFCMVKPKE